MPKVKFIAIDVKTKKKYNLGEELGYRCNKCGHIWKPSEKFSKSPPIVCPKCNNPRWNMEDNK